MNIIVGNIISFISAIFTVSSSLQKEKSKIYLYQVLQCGAMVIASLFFISYSGAITFLLCAIRNYLVMKEKFTNQKCIIFMIALGVLGVLFNNRGLLGFMPVVGSLIYTYGTLVCQRPVSIKINIFINLCMWAIYECLIFDFVSTIVDGISALITLFSIRKEENKLF